MKPFTIKEAHQFLKLHGVNESWHIRRVDVAGTVPSMLCLFRSVTSQKNFLNSKEQMKVILETWFMICKWSSLAIVTRA